MKLKTWKTEIVFSCQVYFNNLKAPKESFYTMIVYSIMYTMIVYNIMYTMIVYAPKIKHCFLLNSPEQCTIFVGLCDWNVCRQWPKALKYHQISWKINNSIWAWNNMRVIKRWHHFHLLINIYTSGFLCLLSKIYKTSRQMWHNYKDFFLTLCFDIL